MPKAGGATALFIDWIGVGGGVGPGFHGVGAVLAGLACGGRQPTTVTVLRAAGSAESCFR